MFKKGFALMELLIYMATGAIAGTLLISLLVSNNMLFTSEQAKIDHGLNLNEAVAVISNNIRLASSIAAGYPVSSPTILSNANNLVIALSSIDASNNIIDNKFDYLVLRADPINPKILMEELYPDPASSRSAYSKVLSRILSNLTFTYLDKDDIVVSAVSATKIKFIISLQSQVGYSADSAQGQVNLRND